MRKAHINHLYTGNCNGAAIYRVTSLGSACMQHLAYTMHQYIGNCGRINAYMPYIAYILFTIIMYIYRQSGVRPILIINPSNTNLRYSFPVGTFPEYNRWRLESSNYFPRYVSFVWHFSTYDMLLRTRGHRTATGENSLKWLIAEVWETLSHRGFQNSPKRDLQRWRYL